MTWSWGPIAEKPEGVSGISALRSIAIMLGLVVARGIWIMADRDQLGGVDWPLAAIVAVVTFAVPVDGFLRALTAWLSSSQGRAIAAKAAEKVLGKLTSISIDAEPDPAPGAAGSTVTEVKTTVNPPEAE